MKKAFLLVLALFVVAGGVFIYRFTYPPQGGSPDINTQPLQEQQRRRAEARKLEAQVRDLATSARRQEQKRFSIIATEEQLNTLLQDRLKVENAPVRDLRVVLQPDTLVLRGKVDYNGFKDLPAALEGRIAAQNGKLHFEVNELKIGGINAPTAWRDKVENAVAPRLNKLLAKAPGRIDSAVVDTGKLTLEGITD